MTFQEESIGRSTIDQEVGEMQYYFRSISSVVKYPHYSPADRENSLGPFLIFIIAPVLHSHSPLPYIPTTTSHPTSTQKEALKRRAVDRNGCVGDKFYYIFICSPMNWLPLLLCLLPIHFTLHIPQSTASHEYNQRQRNMLGNNRKFIIYRFGKW